MASPLRGFELLLDVHCDLQAVSRLLCRVLGYSSGMRMYAVATAATTTWTDRVCFEAYIWHFVFTTAAAAATLLCNGTHYILYTVNTWYEP